MERRGAPAGCLVLEVLARPTVDGGRPRLVGGDLDARDLRPIGARQVDERAAGVHHCDHRVDVALGRELRRRLGGEPGAVERQRDDLDGGEVGPGARDRDLLVLVRSLAARAHGADDLVADGERDAAGQCGRAAQGERSQAPVRHLLFELTARTDEDRRTASLVDCNTRARDLCPRCAPQRDELAVRVDDGDDDA